MKYNILPPYQMLFALRFFFILMIAACIATLMSIEEELTDYAMISFIITIILGIIVLWIKILHSASKSYYDLLKYRDQKLINLVGFNMLQKMWYTRYKSLLDISGVKKVEDDDFDDDYDRRATRQREHEQSAMETDEHLER